MRLFSRNQEAVEAAPGDEAPFEGLRRSPRNARKSRVAGGAFDGAPALDPADALKTRARRRLIGAVALGLAAVVFVPMLFDRTPVPPNDDIALQIPDRNTPFEGRRGVPEPSKGPLKPSSDTPTTSSIAPTIETPVPQAPPPDTVPSMAEPAEKSPEPAVKARVAEKPAEKPVEKGADKAPPAKTPPNGDDPRAIAALEGRTESTAAKGYAVQIAAFSAAEKARGLRDQLVASGLKSYTESVSTAQGLRTRVRLGPFASREAADVAKQKLKTMKLDGSVVPL